MSDIYLTPFYLIIGVLTGSLSGLLGIGGGVLFVPVLIFSLPLTGLDSAYVSYVALATSLFAGSFSASGAGFNHYRINNINLKEAILLALGSCAASIILPKYVVKVYPETLQLILIVILFIVALNLFLNKSDRKENGIKLTPYVLPIFGIATGTLSVFTGLGGGVIFVPVLFYLYKMDIKKAIGTSSVVVAVTMISSAVIFSNMQIGGLDGLYLGYINVGVGLSLGIGALIGSFLGVKFFNKVKAVYIKKIFSVFLLLVILLIMLK